jgi:UDP-N-acetyl-D-galactosamine dehydrogenase
VSGQDKPTLDRIADAYGSIVSVGVYRAESIKVAEAAKVIENTQRDLNIALMNELAIIFDRIGIRTADVLKAASTKWNFMSFRPGLVGGHCISVDPYYLTMKAQQLGYRPEVILAGRRINDNVGAFIAKKTVKLLIEQDVTIKNARVGVLGVTFKENCNDIRNSKVPDIIHELNEFGIKPVINDPLADQASVNHEYGLQLSPLKEMTDLDALILAVSHKEYLALGQQRLVDMIRNRGVMVDVKSLLDPKVDRGIKYWSL